MVNSMRRIFSSSPAASAWLSNLETIESTKCLSDRVPESLNALNNCPIVSATLGSTSTTVCCCCAVVMADDSNDGLTSLKNSGGICEVWKARIFAWASWAWDVWEGCLGGVWAESLGNDDGGWDLWRVT
jgi:hypothetical protein